VPKAPYEAKPSPFGLDRLVFFSDAVMAIAITLLVLDIKVPEAAGGSARDLTRAVLGMWPKILGYIVSFWVIALYWVAHHRCFRYIRKYDRRLMYLNFLFLMFIAFMPFPTALLFSSSARTAPVVLYAGTAAGMGLSLALLWIYAVRRRFIPADMPREVVRDIGLNLLLPPVVFLLSAIAAAFNANLAMYLWFLLIPVYVLRRHTETVLMGHEEP
jgi:TMEM175 potassium channel family protein